MKVWVVMHHVPYEFGEPEAVYDNYERAREHAAVIDTKGDGHGEVVEFEINVKRWD